MLGALLAVVVYVTLHALGRPLFVYLPIHREFVWNAPPDSAPMKLFGYVGGAVLAWCVGQLIGRAARERLSALVPRLRTALVVATLAALLYLLVYELTVWWR